jgi:coenzyme Q-binding protein COQ10
VPHFSTSRKVDITVDQAFAIAADVGSYRDFLPLVERSTLRGARTKTDHGESFDADLAVGYSKLGVRESFTSHVVCDPLNSTVTATSNDGPMRSLKAVWKITSQPGGTAEVSITVDYALKSMMLQMMARGLMDFAAQKIMQAFEERGRALYGSRLI